MYLSTLGLLLVATACILADECPSKIRQDMKTNLKFKRYKETNGASEVQDEDWSPCLELNYSSLIKPADGGYRSTRNTFVFPRDEKRNGNCINPVPALDIIRYGIKSFYFRQNGDSQSRMGARSLYSFTCIDDANLTNHYQIPDQVAELYFVNDTKLTVIQRKPGFIYFKELKKLKVGGLENFSPETLHQLYSAAWNGCEINSTTYVVKLHKFQINNFDKTEFQSTVRKDLQNVDEDIKMGMMQNIIEEYGNNYTKSGVLGGIFHAFDIHIPNSNETRTIVDIQGGRLENSTDVNEWKTSLEEYPAILDADEDFLFSEDVFNAYAKPAITNNAYNGYIQRGRVIAAIAENYAPVQPILQALQEEASYIAPNEEVATVGKRMMDVITDLREWKLTFFRKSFMHNRIRVRQYFEIPLVPGVCTSLARKMNDIDEVLWEIQDEFKCVMAFNEPNCECNKGQSACTEDRIEDNKILKYRAHQIRSFRLCE